MSPQSVRRARSIRDRGVLERTLRGGRIVRTPYFRLCYLAGSGPPRIAFLAGRRVGGAVQRNRAKRVLREAYRTSESDLSGIETLVFVATEKLVDTDFHTVKSKVDEALACASQKSGS